MGSLNPTMSVAVAGQISGPDIINDLLSRIEASLQQSGDLRSVDSYSGYSGKISIQLQLRDVDNREVNREVSVGTIDPARPVRQYSLQPQVSEVADSGHLEKPIQPVPVAQEVREAVRPRNYNRPQRG